MAHFAFNNKVTLTVDSNNTNMDITMQVASPRKRKAKETFVMDINKTIAKRHSPWNHKQQQAISERKLSLRSASKFRPIQQAQQQELRMMTKKEDQNVNNCNITTMAAVTTTATTTMKTKMRVTGKQSNKKTTNINVPEGVASKEDVVTVLTSNVIKPSKHPMKELNSTLTLLNSTKWSETFYAIESVRRLAIFNKELLMPHLELVINATLRNCMNLRSAIAKNSLYALNDLFKSMKESILFQNFDNSKSSNNNNNIILHHHSNNNNAFIKNNNDNSSGRNSSSNNSSQSSNDVNKNTHSPTLLINSIVSTLINRTVADKKFLRDNSNKALFTLISYVPCEETLNALLKCANHKRSSARGRVAIFVEKCLNQMGKEKIQKTFLKSTNDATTTNGLNHMMTLNDIVKGLIKLYNGHVQDSRIGATGALKHIFAAVGATKFQFLLNQMVHPTESKRILSSIQRLISKNANSRKGSLNQRNGAMSLKEKIRQRKKMMMMAKNSNNSNSNNQFGCVVTKPSSKPSI